MLSVSTIWSCLFPRERKRERKVEKCARSSVEEKKKKGKKRKAVVSYNRSPIFAAMLSQRWLFAPILTRMYYPKIGSGDIYFFEQKLSNDSSQVFFWPCSFFFSLHRFASRAICRVETTFERERCNG